MNKILTLPKNLPTDTKHFSLMHTHIINRLLITIVASKTSCIFVAAKWHSFEYPIHYTIGTVNSTQPKIEPQKPGQVFSN